MALGLLLGIAILQAGAPGEAVPWARTASPQEIAGVYPAAAMAQNIAGSAVMNCTVGAAGELTGCAAEGEPDAYGFATAVVELASKFKVGVNTPPGAGFVGRKVRVPIRWLNDAKVQAPPIVVYDDALRRGTVALNCRVRDDRKVDNCVVVDARPRGTSLFGIAGETALRQKAPQSAAARSRVLLVVEVKPLGG